ncbi:hypothetical protein KDM41_18180 [bacterium]|nr:hypothetical protein [bacterium]
MRHPAARLVLVLVLLAVVPAVARAGGASPHLLMREFGPAPEIAYRFLHPRLAVDAYPVGWSMGAHEFSVAVPAGRRVVVWLGLPRVTWAVDGIDLPDESAWGNLTLGVQAGGGNESGVVAGCDLVLPTAQNRGRDLLTTGLLADPYHLETFIPDLLTIRPYAQTKTLLAPDATFRFLLGPDLLVPTGDAEGDIEALVRYGVGLGLDNGTVAVSLELAGQWLVTGNGDFASDSEHFVAAGFEYLGHSVRPALSYRIPTDGTYDNVLDGIVGLRIRVLP